MKKEQNYCEIKSTSKFFKSYFTIDFDFFDKKKSKTTVKSDAFLPCYFTIGCW